MDNETKALMRQIADDAASNAVARTLTSIGIDHKDPIGAQHNMQALGELRKMLDDDEYKADMIHLRRWRKTVNSVEGKGFLAVMGLLATGAVALIMYAFKFKGLGF